MVTRYPPNIGAAGLTDLLDQAIAVSEDLYKLLEREAPATAGYAVINARTRRVRSEFDLWQLYHLVNLAHNAGGRVGYSEIL